MKTVLITLAAAISLSACATGPTIYGPAQSGGLGFSTQQIENNRFHISFTGKNAEEARNLTLLRAAEVTKERGFSHFRVIGSALDGDQYRRSPVSTSVGLGIGSGGYRRGTRTNVGVGININDLGRALNGNKVTSNMEIILSNGNPAGSDNIYRADSIIESIGARAVTQ
ncbi:MAG: hypothetical protein JKX72_01670 [Robiginitomaculum sp.]|nr:hypothetical protein [Robiginitomaculum sp.]